MDDLIAFVTARLDEDEAAAEAAAAASAPDWHHTPAVTVHGPIILIAGGEYDEFEVADIDRNGDDKAAHITRHDPARALREVAAKRKTLARHSPVRSAGRRMCATCLGSCTFWPCYDLRDLAAVWSGHPDYRQEWKP